MIDRVAVVTGTSRGLGREIARQLAARKLRVIATSRDETAGRRSAKELGLAFHPLDVTSRESIEAFARWLEDEHGGLDVLVNNAGTSLDGDVASVAKRTLDVNFLGTVRTTDRLLPLVRDAGRIVMISSGMGELSCLGAALQERFGNPTLTREELMALTSRFLEEVGTGAHTKSGYPSNAYRVSKVAMNAYVRILARELVSDPRRIKVNAACPGWVRTAMGGEGAPLSPEDGAKTPLWLALLGDEGPHGGFFREQHAVPW